MLCFEEEFMCLLKKEHLLPHKVDLSSCSVVKSKEAPFVVEYCTFIIVVCTDWCIGC